METKTLAVLTEPAIVAAIDSCHPTIRSLLDYNPEGTLKLLVHAEALVCRRYNSTIAPQFGGDDNIKTWSFYKVKIEEFLKKSMNHRHLEKARTAVAELIHNRHFAVYPYWPAWGETQESIIRVKKHDHYPSVNMEVFWSVFGYITVTDRHGLGKSRFETECSGDPDVKAVMVNRTKMRDVEALAQEDMRRMKRMVDDMGGRLTWEALARLTI